MGGIWERLIRYVEGILKEQTPLEKAVHTLYLELEYIVNCRPCIISKLCVLDERKSSTIDDYF